MEREWRDSGLNVFYQAWKDHLGEYRTEIESTRFIYLSQIIDNNQSNPRHLFHTINRLLKVNDGISLPVSNKLCNDLHNLLGRYHVWKPPLACLISSLQAYLSLVLALCAQLFSALLMIVVPAALKTAAVTPVPKKHNADLGNLNNYRPISNLPFIAKMLQRVVALQVHIHLIVNNRFEPLQSDSFG